MSFIKMKTGIDKNLEQYIKIAWLQLCNLNELCELVN